VVLIKTNFHSTGRNLSITPTIWAVAVIRNLIPLWIFMLRGDKNSAIAAQLLAGTITLEALY
jgi:hypothetical protein